MDNEKLDRIALLLENIDKNFNTQFDRLEKKVDKIEQDISVLKQQNAALAEAINTTNQNLSSKIDMLDKKFDERYDILEGRTNINTIDINKLRAAR